MIVNFLLDSRFGGPQMILGHLKTKLRKKKKTIFLDTKNKDFFFSNFKKFFKIFYVLDIIFNLIILTINFKKFKNQKIFLVFSLLNIVPVIFGIFFRKKIFWYILEKPNLIFFLVFKILNLYSKLEIICITKSLAKMLKIKKYSIYFPTIDCDFWKRKTQLSNNFPNQTQTLVSVGNLNKTKNHINLIKFLEFSQLKYKLIIIGNMLNNQKDYYNRLIKLKDSINSKNINKIEIHQNKKKKFIKKVLNQSDIFILPSLEEGLSIALVEAMSMKSICLVSKPSNHSKIILNNINGFEFELNKESLSKVLKSTYNIKAKNKKKISKYARQTILKLISKNVIYEKKIINKLFSDHQ